MVGVTPSTRGREGGMGVWGNTPRKMFEYPNLFPADALCDRFDDILLK